VVWFVGVWRLSLNQIEASAPKRAKNTFVVRKYSTKRFDANEGACGIIIS